MNLINTLNGHEYGYFLAMGLSSCPFCSSFILNNGLRTAACLSDVNVDVYKFNEIHDFLIGLFSYASSHILYWLMCTTFQLEIIRRAVTKLYYAEH